MNNLENIKKLIAYLEECPGEIGYQVMSVAGGFATVKFDLSDIEKKGEE
jgi:hypothetical protein